MIRWIEVLAALLTTLASPTWASPRADIVVYADHQPPPITTNPFVAQEDADDPATNILLEAVPGLYDPLGTITWSIEAWGKYVLLAPYDEAGGGLFANIADQRIGVFDTEKKTFCQLDIDPNAVVNAGVEWLAVATPALRQSRIYFQGFGDPTFGWIEGDLDNPNPCDPMTGWSIVRFTAADLDAAAAGLGSAKGRARATSAGSTACGCCATTMRPVPTRSASTTGPRPATSS